MIYGAACGKLTLATAPAARPLSRDTVKMHLRMDSDGHAEDALVDDLIDAAKETAEAHTRRAFITQTWDWKLDGFPSCEPWELPKAPLQSVTSITYTDTAGDSQTWSSANYTVVAPAGPRAEPGTVSAAYGVSYPALRAIPYPLTVRFVCGYGTTASTVPAAIRQAMLLLCAEMYARREAAIVGTIITEVPVSVARLLAPYVVHGW